MKKEMQDSDLIRPGEEGTNSSGNGRNFTLRLIIQLLVFIILIPLLPILISGRYNWWEAWVYAIINIMGFIISRIITARINPDLIKERAHSMDLEGAKSWDKVLAPMVSLGGGMIPIIAGFDELYNWSPESGIPVKVIALIFFISGYVFGSYALAVNRFFSGVVRIQTDRGHKVVSTGPYSLVRHPGYAGSILAYLATPFFLDSSWALIPALFIIMMLIIRTYLEDNTLKNELEGYRVYAEKVKYRIFPGIW